MRVDPAYLFILLLGIVSLLADVTYEGARSLLGPFLGALGASAATVSFIAGLGEFVAYALRLLFGAIADRTRRYFAITFAGYMINLLAVPALALAGSWQSASFLVLLERLGKAVRTPARDAWLSQATARVGHGRGFGLHELLDQIGAVLGPILVGVAFSLTKSYRTSFALLLIPALLALGTLFLAGWLFPQPKMGQELSSGGKASHLPKAFWLWLSFVALSFVGLSSFPLIAFHLKMTAHLEEPRIAFFFALAMSVDALVAFPLGYFFDRAGLKVLLALPILSSLAALSFSGKPSSALVGVIFFGATLGLHESVLRAAVAQIVPAPLRGTGYGVFHAISGAAFFLGGVLLGALYALGSSVVVGTCVAFQLVSLCLGLTFLKSQMCANGKSF